MKKKNLKEHSLPIIVTDEGFSLVKLHYSVCNQSSNGYFLLDTASVVSYVYDAVDAEDAKVSLSALSLQLKPAKAIQGINGYSVKGLLGVDFFLKFGGIIDYATRRLLFNGFEYSPQLSYPMTFGLKKFGVPIIGISCGGQTRVAIIDSGANVNLRFGHLSAGSERAVVSTQLGEYFEGIVKKRQFELSFFKNGIIEWLEYSGDFIETGSNDCNILYGTSLDLADYIIGNKFLVEHKYVLDFKEVRILIK